MRSLRSLNQPRQSVYTPQPHMSFFIPKPTEKPVTPPKPVTAIHACLWSQNPHPQTQKKKKKKKKTQWDLSATSTHQLLKPTDQHFAAADTIFTFNHRRWGRWPPPIPRPKSSCRHSSTIPTAAVFTVLAPPQPLIPTVVDPKHRVHHRASFQCRGCCPFWFLWFPFFVLSLSCSLRSFKFIVCFL